MPLGRFTPAAAADWIDGGEFKERKEERIAARLVPFERLVAAQ
jgi:hypothetical protein